MSKGKIIASLDVGSHKIRTIVGVIDEQTNQIQILGMGFSPSEGIRKSMIVDIEEAVRCISSALEDAERMAGEPINQVFLGMGGHHLESTNSKGVIAISHPSGEIMDEDIDRSLEAAQAMAIPNNRRILRIIPKTFSVDEQTGIKYPVGMTGIRLEVDAHIVTGLTPAVKNLEKSVLHSGVDISDIIPNPLASSEAILSKRQKELGVVVVDIGCGSTIGAVYEEGIILHSHVIPIGRKNVTNDVAIGLKTSIETAEKIKIEYGTTNPETIDSKEQIDLSLISKIDLQQVNRKTLCQIMEARYVEIFNMVLKSLEDIGRDGMLPAGVVLTGGGAKVPGLVDMAREKLKLPVQIGIPQGFEGLTDKVEDTSYSTALGLLVWASRYQGQGVNMNFDLSKIDFSRVTDTFRSWFKNLMP